MKKKPSGAHWRRLKAEKSKSTTVTAGYGSSGYGVDPFTTRAYRMAGEQWDSSKPPFELPLYGLPPPTIVPQIEATIMMLEQGTFYAPAYLWDGMLRDDRITATLNVRINGLLGEKRLVTPADESDEALKISELAEEKMSKMLPDPQLAQLMRYGLGLSVGIAQVISSRTESERNLTIKVWNPRFLRYDWLLRKYCLITENRGEIVLDPEDPEWIIYEPYGPHGWLHGALLRSLVRPWLIRTWTRTWWARYQEVHGSPFRAGIMPSSRDPADERRFLSDLANIGYESVMRLPQGKDGNNFDVKLIEASANNWKGFDELMKHCDRSIEIVLLGQSQSTEGQGGLGTQEKAGEDTMLRVLRGDAAIGEMLRQQVLMPWAADNFGNADMAPCLTWDIEPPEDASTKSQTVLHLAQAMQAFNMAGAGADLDVRALYESFDLPLLEKSEVVEVPKPVPTAPTSPTSPDEPAEPSKAKPDAPDDKADEADKES